MFWDNLNKKYLKTNKEIQFILKVIDKTPIIFLPVIINFLKISKLYNMWPIYWGFIVEESILKLSALDKNSDFLRDRNFLILKMMGNMPSKTNLSATFKYKTNIYWKINYINNEFVSTILELAENYNYNLSDKDENGLGFIYSAIITKNKYSLKWFLEKGYSANDIDKFKNSLLKSALSRTSPKEDEIVRMLLSYGACWDYKSIGGLSGLDYIKDFKPEWVSWKEEYENEKQKQRIIEELKNTNNLERKKRRM